MNKEIERKFILNEIMVFENISSINQIDQYYLSIDPEVRIRKSVMLDNLGNSICTKYTITEKSEGTIERTENESEINEKVFKALLNIMGDNFKISKVRTTIELKNGLFAEVDIYSGEHEGLKVVEVEFKNINEANNFEIPSWFGKEITDDKNYKNKNLALNKKL